MRREEFGYSPVLWATMLVPVLSSFEVLVNNGLRERFGPWCLAATGAATIRYSITVCAQVYDDIDNPKLLSRASSRRTRLAAWSEALLVLVLAALCLPALDIWGAELFLLTVSVIAGSTLFYWTLRDKSDIMRRVLDHEAPGNSALVLLVFDAIIFVSLVYAWIFLGETANVNDTAFQPLATALIFSIVLDLGVGRSGIWYQMVRDLKLFLKATPVP